MPDTTESPRPIARQEIEPELFLKRYRHIADAARDSDGAKALWKSEISAAKGSGINIKALKLCDKIRRMTPLEGQSYLRYTILYLRWLGCDILDQEDLVSDEQTSDITAHVMQTHKAWEAGNQGYKAGKSGSPLDANPHRPGSEEHSRWAIEWRDGQDDRNGVGARDIHPGHHDEGNPEDPPPEAL